MRCFCFCFIYSPIPLFKNLSYIGSCPSGLVTSNIAPAHPHLISVAVYPASLLFKTGRWNENLLLVLYLFSSVGDGLRLSDGAWSISFVPLVMFFAIRATTCSNSGCLDPNSGCGFETCVKTWFTRAFLSKFLWDFIYISEGGGADYRFDIIDL